MVRLLSEDNLNVERSQRLASLLQREITGLLQSSIKDPRLESVTITRVEVSADCRNARVLFTLLGDQSGAKEASKGFKKAGGFLRSKLGRTLHMRQVPELRFEHDLIMHQATEVRLMIDRVVREDEERQRERGDLAEPDIEDGELED